MPKVTTKKEKQIELDKLKQLINKLGRKPTDNEINICEYTKTSGYFKWHYKSLKNVFKMIDKNLLKHNNRLNYSNDDIINEFYRVKKMLGYCPSFKQMKKHAKFNPQIIQKRWKKWSLFLKDLNEKRQYIANDGHICDSRIEVEIDNILSQLKIKHKKNIKYPYHKTFNVNNKKTCDWLINDVYVEYCGLMNYFDKKLRDEYCNKIAEKLEYLINNNINFLFITPSSIKEIEQYIKEEFIRGGQNSKL